MVSSGRKVGRAAIGQGFAACGTSPDVTRCAVQVTDFEVNDWLREKIDATADELSKEKDCVGHLIPGSSFAACAIKEDTMLPGEN